MFQEANLKHRLLITNINVSSLSISFDDVHGGFPRYAFGEAGFAITGNHQWTHRFYRVSTRSTPVVRFVYGNVVDSITKEDCGVLETSILTAIANKSAVMKETLKVQVEGGVEFPSDYERHIEKDLKYANLIIEIPQSKTQQNQEAAIDMIADIQQLIH